MGDIISGDDEMKKASIFGKSYRSIYGNIAGKHPSQKPWHHQWAAVEGLHKELKKMAPRVTGDVLDVGCGEKPYKAWFSGTKCYVGVDIVDGSEVDYIIKPQDCFPFSDGQFDAVIALEVLEHVEYLAHTLNEIQRVLKRGGRIITAIPFLYNEHGAPGDFRRLTKFSADKLFYPSCTLTMVKPLGGIGTTLSILLLNWVETAVNQNKTARFVKAMLLPLWLVFSLMVNMFGKALDCIDKTDSFYSNVLMVFQKDQKTELPFYQSF